MTLKHLASMWGACPGEGNRKHERLGSAITNSRFMELVGPNGGEGASKVSHLGCPWMMIRVVLEQLSQSQIIPGIRGRH